MRIGERLFQNGELADHAVIIRKGRVKLLLAGRIEIGTYGAGSILGLSELFAQQTYQAEAIAVEETIAGYLPRQMLLDMMLHDSRFGFALLEHMSHEMHHVTKELQNQPSRRKYTSKLPALGGTKGAA
jgi:CRP-like cAMP-binding protein